MTMDPGAEALAQKAAAVVTQLGSLAPPPQRTVDGTPGGVHRAARRGGGIEFAEHRDYAPGDDLRHVDWRAFARSDRYTVKRFEQEVHASVTLLLDASASMQVATGSEVDKMAAVRLLAASLATWVIQSGDAVGLVVAGRNIALPASGGKTHLRRLIGHLAALKPEGAAGFDGLGREVLRGPERRGTVIAISDFLADPAFALAPLAQLRRLGPRVLALATLHPLELDLSLGGNVELVCGETHRRDRVDARSVRGAYQEMLQRHLEHLRVRAVSGGIDLQVVDLSTPPQQVLRLAARRLAGQQRAGYSWSAA